VKWRVAVASAATAVAFAGVVAVADAERPDVIVAGPSDTLNAVDVLQSIRVERENPRGYSRSLFKHWLDTDGDGCDAREQVLKRDAVGFAQVDPFRCYVVEADWLSPYDGRKTSDRTEVDIDHMVALKEAWDSGAWAWNEAQRTAFANDTSDARTLIAVSGSSNRSKSDKDPSNWLPPLRGYWCTYVSNWVSVKARWNMSMDQSEWGRLNNVLSDTCVGTTMRGWSPPATSTIAPSTIAPSTTRATTATSTPSSTAATSTPTSTAATTRSTTAPAGSATTSTMSTTQASDGSLAAIRPGAFCTPEGALGNYGGRTYVCSKTDAKGTPYSNGSKRWRQQT